MLAGMVAGDESPLCAAEAIVVLRLLTSVLVDEMAVVSEVPTDILILNCCND